MSSYRHSAASARWISSALLLLLASLPLEATPEAWKRRGGGAPVVVDPLNANNLYALVAFDFSKTGTYASTDGGLTWMLMSTSTGFYAYDLAIDSDGSGGLYTLAVPDVMDDSFPRLFKSLDRGRTWLSLNRTAFTVFVDPVETGRIWIGGEGRIETSADRGATWSGVSTTGGTPIISFARSPLAPSTLYAGASSWSPDYAGARILKSSDAGRSWSASDRGLALVSVEALALDPSNLARVVAGTSRGIYVSEDEGETWSLSVGVETRALASEPLAGTVIYAGTYGRGVLRSFDHGLTWFEFNTGLESLYVNSFAVARGGRLIYAGTSEGVFAYEVPAGPVDLSVAADGSTRFSSFDGSTRRLAFGSVGPDGRVESSPPYGPYAGWTPLAQADGGDGATRLLWTHEDGSTALWLAEPGGVRASFRYLPIFGLTAIDVAAGPGSDTHILWKDTNGAADLWTIDGSGDVARALSFGPYRGWTPLAIGDGPDGLTRLLWSNSDGRAGLSLVSSDGILTTARYESTAGWTTLDVAVGGDGLTRILRAHEDGRFALRVVEAAGEITIDGAVYPAPEGMTARRIAAGPDGSSRVLFTNPRGDAALGLLSAGGAYEGLVPLTPSTSFPPDSTWIGTFTWVSATATRPLCPEITSQIGGSWPLWIGMKIEGSSVTLLLSEGPPSNDPMDEGPAVFRGTIVGNSITASDASLAGGFACPADKSITREIGGDLTANVSGNTITGEYTTVYGSGADAVTLLFRFDAARSGANFGAAFRD